MLSPASAPTVLAVVVTHDGAPWLRRSLQALGRQTYPHLDVIAVDNASTDGSRDILIEALGERHVVVSEEDLGFGAAVSLALDAHDGRIALALPPAELVLLVHDDLVLEPAAVSELVGVLRADERVAIVGPKLRHWGGGRRLQSVGSTIDVTGRVDDGVDIGELDQGQRDDDRRVLYVSTSGMLVRRAVFDEIGRFDRRYRAFRDDLDLCWRAAMAGHDTEVVPAAVGSHVGAAADYARPGRTSLLGPRYLAERNTLATLIKNYGARRLALVLPLALIVGAAKVAAFVVTRRVGDASQTVAAWGWNIAELRSTLRARRLMRPLRRRTDADLSDLFGRVTPRLRAYLEAIVEWVAGGDAAADLPDEVDPDAESPSVLARLRDLARQRPILVSVGPLALVLAVAAWPVLLPGDLRGGDLAPWPASASAFLTDYVAGWHDVGGVGTGLAPSPAQAILGLLHLAVAGSTYVAPRLLLIAPPIIAWLLALKAAQRFSVRRVPRVVAATAYVLSPPALAAFSSARLGASILLALLPGAFAAASSAADRRTPIARAWRAVAALVLMIAVAVAFEPGLAPVVAVIAGGAIVRSAMVRDDRSWRFAALARSLTVGVVPFVLLAPWSFAFLTRANPLAGNGDGVTGGRLWRWILLVPPAPDALPVVAGVGLVLASVLALVLASARAPRVVVAAWGMAIGGAVIAWIIDAYDLSVWSGTPLVIAVAGHATLVAVGFDAAGDHLARHDVGWRHVTVASTALAVSAGVVLSASGLITGGWAAVRRDDPALPAFVVAAADVAATRVLVLSDEGGRIDWEVVEGHGPTMASVGARQDPAVSGLLSGIVADLVAERDPRAASRLGRVGVRFVVVPDGGTSDVLDVALRAQTALEPRPVAAGRVFEVEEWVPGAAVVAEGRFDPGAVPQPRDPTLPAQALEREGPGRYVGRSEIAGAVVLAEVFDAGWELRVDDRRVPGRLDEGLVRFDDVPADARLVIRNTGQTRRSVAVAGQVLVLLLVVSLGLRPPDLGRRRRREPPVDIGDADARDEGPALVDAVARSVAARAPGDGEGDA